MTPERLKHVREVIDYIRQTGGQGADMLEELADEIDKQEPGTVAFVVIKDPQAHRELMDLCQRWHAKQSNSMYIDCEQSLLSYKST